MINRAAPPPGPYDGKPEDVLRELRLVAAADPEAVARFVDRFYAHILAVTTVVAAGWPTTRYNNEDLAHEILLLLIHREKGRALLRWSPFGGRSLANFIRKYTYLRCIDTLRPTRRELTAHAEVIAEEIDRDAAWAAAEGDPDRQRFQLLKEHYRADCSELDRRLLGLIEEDKEPAEIMKELGLKRGAFDQRMKRLRDKMQALARKLGL